MNAPAVRRVGIVMFNGVELLNWLRTLSPAAELTTSVSTGDAAARTTAQHIEYPYPESNERRK